MSENEEQTRIGEGGEPVNKDKAPGRVDVSDPSRRSDPHPSDDHAGEPGRQPEGSPTAEREEVTGETNARPDKPE